MAYSRNYFFIVCDFVLLIIGTIMFVNFLLFEESEYERTKKELSTWFFSWNSNLSVSLLGSFCYKHTSNGKTELVLLNPSD